MNFYYKYYIELKNRTFLLFYTWFSVLITGYYYKETILFLLINPSNYFNTLSKNPYFIFTNVSEIFYVYLELTFFIANQIMIVMLFYHVLMFLALGLYSFEFNRLRTIFQIFILSWLFSVILLYKFLIPYTWTFFLSFQQNNNDTQLISFFFEAKIIEYFNFFMSLYYICFVNCQFLALLLLIFTNISEKLNKTKTFRKHLVASLFSSRDTRGRRQNCGKNHGKFRQWIEENLGL